MNQCGFREAKIAAGVIQMSVGVDEDKGQIGDCTQKGRQILKSIACVDEQRSVGACDKGTADIAVFLNMINAGRNVT